MKYHLYSIFLIIIPRSLCIIRLKLSHVLLNMIVLIVTQVQEPFFGYFCLILYVRIYCTKCLFMATKYFKFGKHFINKRLPKGNFETMVSHCILYCKVNRPIALRGHVTNASFNNNLESWWCQKLMERIKIILHPKFERKRI